MGLFSNSKFILQPAINIPPTASFEFVICSTRLPFSKLYSINLHSLFSANETQYKRTRTFCGSPNFAKELIRVRTSNSVNHLALPLVYQLVSQLSNPANCFDLIQTSHTPRTMRSHFSTRFAARPIIWLIDYDFAAGKITSAEANLHHPAAAAASHHQWGPHTHRCHFTGGQLQLQLSTYPLYAGSNRQFGSIKTFTRLSTVECCYLSISRMANLRQ